MRLNKMVSVVLACMLIVGTTAVPASAFEAETKSLEINTINDVASRVNIPSFRSRVSGV